MNRIKIRGVVLAVTVSVASGIASAQISQPNGVPIPGSPNQSGAAGLNAGNSLSHAPDSLSGASLQDRSFLKDATQGSNFEIKAGQLAQQKSTSDDVKQFGQMMVTDHTKLNTQMVPVAAQAGVQPPTGISKKDQKLYDSLASKSGADFDNAYIAAMVKDHTEDLKDFRQEAGQGQLPAEKDAAAKGAIVVEGHLQAAKQLAQAHNVSLDGKGL